MAKPHTFLAFDESAQQWFAKRGRANRPSAPIPCACFNVRKASRAISHLYDEALHPVGLRGTQFSLLIAISYVGQEGVGALADVLFTDRTTLTRSLRPLVQRGWAAPIQGEDGRKHAYRLTAEGREKLDAAIPLWERAQERVAESLGEESLVTLRLLADDIVSLSKGKK